MTPTHYGRLSDLSPEVAMAVAATPELYGFRLGDPGESIEHFRRRIEAEEAQC